MSDRKVEKEKEKEKENKDEKKKKKVMFVYSWHVDEDNGVTNIRIFGIDKNNKNVYVHVYDFEPYVYIELPRDFPEYKVQQVGDAIDDAVLNKFYRPTTKKFERKKPLYYAHKNENFEDILYPYLRLTFKVATHIRSLYYVLKKKLLVGGEYISLKMHEQDIPPIFQLISRRKLPASGWIRFHGEEVFGQNKDSSCQFEYRVRWENLNISKETIVMNPRVMSFDIEVNSSNPNVMPSTKNKKDVVFQISCVLSKQQQKEEKGEEKGDGEMEKIILSLGNPDQEITGKDVEIRKFKNESDLLDGFGRIMQEKTPNIVIGYNIFGFDIPYMIERAQAADCDTYDKQGFLRGIAGKQRKIKWSSSAYKNQEFTFLDCEGVLYIDLLPIVKRDYKFDNYRLKTIAEHFTGKTKDPLTPKDIFSCYRKNTPKSLGIVAKYCVQDSVLVLKLFDVLKIWVGLTEMSKTCNVPILTLFTQGQQIKIFSQVYRYCLNKNMVVEKDAYVVKENETFTGAYVFEPLPGLYDMVAPFDFSSLYPTTMLAYNIDYSTLVLDDNVPDEKCHVISWSEHKNCKHDLTIKIKKKKIEEEKIEEKKIEEEEETLERGLCGEFKYRFLKEPQGVIPSIIQNMLDMRKMTNAEIKVLKEKILKLKKEIEDGKEKEEKEEKDEKDNKQQMITDLRTEIDVLDKRQLSYKVNANSMYGAMGVRRGYLPFLAGAMSTTAKGRESIDKVAKYIQSEYKAKLIYGDTDSCYVSFPQFLGIKDAGNCYEFCKKVENEMLKLFPPPMKLAFEDKIYWRFFILTKKRYMALTMDKNGKVSENIFKKGVLLNRRDNSKMIREVYGETIMKIFYKAEEGSIVNNIFEKIDILYQKGRIDCKELVITKATGSMVDYKIKSLPEDEKKCIKRLQELLEEDLEIHIGDGSIEKIKSLVKQMVDSKVFSLDLPSSKEYEISTRYVTKCLPSQVQLALKMKNRGKPVDVGTRLEYIILDGNGKKKLFDKIEDIEYYKENSSVLKIDPHYYLKLMINPIDQLLKVAYGYDKIVEKHYKIRLTKSLLINELDNIFSPTLVFEEDKE